MFRGGQNNWVLVAPCLKDCSVRIADSYVLRISDFAASQKRARQICICQPNFAGDQLSAIRATATAVGLRLVLRLGLGLQFHYSQTGKRGWLTKYLMAKMAFNAARVSTLFPRLQSKRNVSGRCLWGQNTRQRNKEHGKQLPTKGIH